MPVEFCSKIDRSELRAIAVQRATLWLPEIVRSVVLKTVASAPLLKEIHVLNAIFCMD